MVDRDDSGGRRTMLGAFVVVLYATALALPAVKGPLSDNKIRGYEALFYGYSWPFTIAWSANIALLAGLLAFGGRLFHVALGAAAVGLCLAWTSPLVMEESMSAFGPGFHVWWGTFVVLGLVSAVESSAQRSTES